MNATKRTKRVALYVRVSTDHQTVKNQERELQPLQSGMDGPWCRSSRPGHFRCQRPDERPGLDKLLQAVARRNSIWLRHGPSIVWPIAD